VRMSSQESFGRRLRRLRLERGLSQTQLSAPGVSPSYLSLLEAGKRAPTQVVVRRLADRLGCDVGLLTDGVRAAEAAEVELELRYAELALHSGEAAEAVDRFRALRERDVESTPASLVTAARWGLARALEAIGEVEAAIPLFEEAREEAETAPEHSAWLPAVMALCACYLEVGDLTHSVEIGERARARIQQLGLAGSDAEVELLSTLVGCYQERGDLVRARLLAEEAVRRAEQLGTSRARGAAYWNASLVSQELGRTAEALTFAQRALALYADGDDIRALGRLRTAYAWVLLHQQPPQVEQAESLLVRALRDLEDVGSEVDLAYGETELARVRLVSGRAEEAAELAARSLDRLGSGRRLETARARLVQGQASLALGDEAAALASYRRAAEDLTTIKASRQAAAGWRELAEVLRQLGRDAEAMAAYQRALDALGIGVAMTSDARHSVAR
jgi:tetratricopeptide (TPR) repeat protein